MRTFSWALDQPHHYTKDDTVQFCALLNMCPQVPHVIEGPLMNSWNSLAQTDRMNLGLDLKGAYTL